MEQSAKSFNKSASASITKTDYLVKEEKAGIFTRLFGDIEFNRYGLISIILIFNMTLGGVAVGLGAMTSVWQLTLLVIPTMALLTWILAVQPMKTILSIATVAAIIDIAIILYNIL